MRSFSSSSFGLFLQFVLVALVTLTGAHPRGILHVGRDEPTQTTKYPVPANAVFSFAYPYPASPCSGAHCTNPTPLPSTLACEAANGTTLVTAESSSAKYTIICDIDFPAQNIYPFILAGSFKDCLAQCERYNEKRPTTDRCAGVVFAPDRVHDGDDCYLKSSLNGPGPATIHLVGATIITSSSSPTLISLSSPFSTPLSNLDHNIARVDVKGFKVLGTSTNKPTKQYVSHVPATPEKLADRVLTPGLNTDLITRYPMADDTGCWTTNQFSGSIKLSDMKSTPQMSRDGGKGGTINGTHIFVFCDTASFDPNEGMVGFVSSSVATDQGMKAIYGLPLDLVDNLGEWQDDVGRMRGFAPMTAGEESFNIALSGQGYRYAVWPESSLIPLNASHALLYPALVYDVVKMDTQDAAFHNIGNSLLLVSVDPVYGPSAERVVAQLYKQDQVTFGTLGGIRSWGPAGKGGNDGHIYLFGKGDHGVLVAKTTPGGFSDVSAYQYWTGASWSNDIPSASSTAVLLGIQVQDLDVIYVPAMRSFLMIYLNTLADNTFYYRHLSLDLDVEDKDSDVDTIVTAQWSDEKVLAKVDAPVEGFIYAGGLHAGYFGSDDITNGGCKMLITWTEHTGKDAASPESGYAHKSAYVEFHFS